MQQREGHFKGMMRLFGYIKKFRKEKIIIEPNYPDHSLYPTLTFDTWKDFYLDSKEVLPNGSEIPDFCSKITKKPDFYLKNAKIVDFDRN